MQASWRAAAASLPPNYHSAQLPAASGSVPARGSRRCRDVGRQLLGRGTHPAAEPRVCYRLPFRKEKEVGGEKASILHRIFVEISLNAKQLVGRVWQLQAETSFSCLCGFTRSCKKASLPPFPMQDLCLQHSATPKCFFLSVGHCRKPSGLVWRKSTIPRPKQAGGIILSSELYMHNLDLNFGQSLQALGLWI